MIWLRAKTSELVEKWSLRNVILGKWPKIKTWVLTLCLWQTTKHRWRKTSSVCAFFFHYYYFYACIVFYLFLYFTFPIVLIILWFLVSYFCWVLLFSWSHVYSLGCEVQIKWHTTMSFYGRLRVLSLFSIFTVIRRFRLKKVFISLVFFI